MPKKNCIITGGTSGLGLELVKKFINNSFFVHIIAKDSEKIKKLTNYFYEKKIKSFKFYKGDLAEKNELDRIILEMQKLDTADIIINNAGALFLRKETNSEGIEKTFAVNHLSHFYLTYSLIGLIKKTENAKLVNISSMLHNFAKPNFNDINSSKKYNGYIAYFNSKLMNILFTYKINKIYPNDIKCYVVNPGWINTNFGNNNKSNIRFLLDLIRNIFARKPSYVADEIFNICTAKKYLNFSGKYFKKGRVSKSSNLSYREDLQDELWVKSLNFINEQKNEIR